MAQATKPCTIVVCDDQDAYRQVVATVLGLEADIEIVGQAGDGLEAIELARELRPDVLLLDISMPVLDGLEALSEIRVSAPDTQVVMLTGVASESIRRRAFDRGACRFIEKGIDVDTLVAEVREVCATRATVSR